MKKILFFIIPLLFFGAFSVQAGVGDNVSGFAWSENIGWLSFNNTSGGGATSYGVNINPSDGEFSGYAWSENIGWIQFNPAGPYPNPPNHSVEVNLSTFEVSGWARALSYGGGWDGWIKMRCHGDECGDSDYGVFAIGSGQLQGFAWGSDVVGWISFAGLSYRVDTSASIFNSPPSRPDIPPEYSPDGITWNHCSFQGRSIPTFHWTYSDPDSDPQSAYEIEVDDNSAFAAPKFNHLVNLAATAYVLDLFQDDAPSDWISALAWNDTYFWRVRVKDDQDNWSDWSNSSQLMTSDHAYPWVDFTRVPAEPTQGETVEFDPDNTVIYGGESISSYSWTVTGGIGTFVDSTGAASQYPHIQFSTLNNRVNLQITDSDSFSCSKEQDITAQLPLPEYKEIPPILWLRKILAGISTFWKLI